MTDSEYIEYAKNFHEEAYALSTPMIEGVAAKVLTRFRKEQPNLFVRKKEWTNCMSNIIDVVDVMSILAMKGITFDKMHNELVQILDQYIIDRFNELPPMHHLILKYRYVGKFGLASEVKERLYEKMKEHYATQRMQNLLQRYPDLKEYKI